MHHRLLWTILLFVFGSSNASAVGQQPPKLRPLEQNAALAYWQAFALMPQLTETEEKLRDDVISGTLPTNQAARNILPKLTGALRYLHRGAKMEQAAWGVAWDEGPFALMPHLSKARELVRLAAFRAIVRFEEGKHEEAVEDLLAAMTLGRHLAKEAVIVLIPLLVDYAIESICLHVLAEYLPEMDAKTRAKLKQKLDALPKTQTLADAIQGEKDVFLPWLIAEVKKPNAKQLVLQFVGKIPDEELQAFKNLNEGELLPATRRMGGYYDQMIETMKLAPNEAKRRHDLLFQEIKANEAKDFLSRWLLPSGYQGKRAEIRNLTRLAMLDAAFAVLEDGDKVLKDPEHKDPFGDGPFEYQETDNGFVLTSDWEIRPGEKLSMTFGKK